MVNAAPPPVLLIAPAPPFAVSVPETLLSLAPLIAPLDDRLARLMLIGVARPAVLTMSSPAPFVAEIEPVLLVTVIWPLLSSPTRPLPFPFVMLRLLKVTGPALPFRFTPVAS